MEGANKVFKNNLFKHWNILYLYNIDIITDHCLLCIHSPDNINDIAT